LKSRCAERLVHCQAGFIFDFTSYYELTTLYKLIKDRFLKRLIGDINVGLNYTKSNSILQFNFSSNVFYNSKVEIDFKFSSVLTSYARDSGLAKKQDIIGSLRRNMAQNFWGTSLGWQQNTELGLSPLPGKRSGRFESHCR
jgi:hypothetical protein